MNAEEVSEAIRELAKIRAVLEPPIPLAITDSSHVPRILPTHCRPLSIPADKQACLVFRSVGYGWWTLALAIKDVPNVVAWLQEAAAGATSAQPKGDK
jgi:hypothetical protein